MSNSQTCVGNTSATHAALYHEEKSYGKEHWTLCSNPEMYEQSQRFDKICTKMCPVRRADGLKPFEGMDTPDRLGMSVSLPAKTPDKENGKRQNEDWSDNVHKRQKADFNNEKDSLLFTKPVSLDTMPEKSTASALLLLMMQTVYNLDNRKRIVVGLDIYNGYQPTLQVISCEGDSITLLPLDWRLLLEHFENILKHFTTNVTVLKNNNEWFKVPLANCNIVICELYGDRAIKIISGKDTIVFRRQCFERLLKLESCICSAVTLAEDHYVTVIRTRNSFLNEITTAFETGKISNITPSAVVDLLDSHCIFNHLCTELVTLAIHELVNSALARLNCT
ncbi:uncharacterized protein LOC112494439 [Cephus cinctus]|uniref:Uncharacterized protein LOC112494439 n=1 Tax=Cephus cinctus TaxID=211228 RepID=A0AAJ7RJB9_CEPCN|nr:uncharacterized protein LOC112494439 [Cephus cinctus]